MNVNYIGSVAERFMKFRSTLQATEGVTENIFNAISIYLPKSLASANLASGSYTPSAITATTPAVVTVTVDNYTSVFKTGGAMLSQWRPVFNDGTNSAVTLFVVIFDDTDFAVTATDKAVTWQPLTTAFEKLYFISFFKTMFSEHYNGKTVEGSGAYDDSNYFDMALCLSYLCENDAELSFDLIEANLEVFTDTDTNVCQVMSHTEAEELAHCTTLAGSDIEDRAEYFWGYWKLMGNAHSEFHIHNGVFMIPIILGKWFEEKNSSGEFVGNKLAKIRLTGNGVKPTGLPSILNGAVNDNLSKAIYDVLDAKVVGYFISISSSSANDAEFIRDRSGSNFPITAYTIAKCINYFTSQELADFRDRLDSLTDPVLCNEATYQKIQAMLVSNIQKFGTTGRLAEVTVNFPAFAEVKVGNSIKGTAVWKAKYIDDLEAVDVSGTIQF